jgi:hypothetical protein
MSNFTDSAHSRQVDQVEHNSDAAAKRVVLKYQDPNTGDWLNFTPNKTPGTDFDYLSIVATSSTTDTLTYRTGGVSGTIVQTLVVTYSSDSVDKISDTLSVLEW